ncbi:GNAT family N-acetyltransferase [Sphingomonas sp. TF3]|uniref:GNAT family N-acetyltransferase n=1 Tax=Sphingomonas sp. TF3 TaxID=2495580 RepID=UPI000F872C01|nr:GNAT family N-acetyltransferase [Sphingomonas sp. TF3]RUN78305.1 GNAT family N-acetyltransferase [Sphingomonas sp. TF3]
MPQHPDRRAVLADCGAASVQAAIGDVVVRPAIATDAPALGRLGAMLVALHHGFDPARFIAAQDSTARGYGAYLDSQRKWPDVLVLVAVRGAVVLGYAYGAIEGTDFMALRGPAGVLYDLMVDPAHRRQGVGRMLLDAVRAYFVARGAPQMLLMTATANTPAQRLFAAAGLRPTMIEMTADLRGDPPRR